MKRDLIVFGEDWGRHPSSTQHLVRRLAEDRRVVWVNSVGMRRPRLRKKDVARVMEKAGRMLSRPKATGPKVAIPENMIVVDPKVVPFPGSKTAARINRKFGGRAIADAIAHANLNDPVIWISVPTAVDLLPALPDVPVVYYCGDDFGGLDGVDHGPVLECEERLADRASRIFSVSNVLSEKFDATKVVDLPHGVDFDLFSASAERPNDLRPHRKIAGFYGSISAWLDQDLVALVAMQRPDWNFVFVGNENCDVSRLRTLSNVEFLGPKAHAELPGYVQHWDVSLLPFVDNAQIRACNPLKLREYMAAGTPIVATPFPALNAYSGWVTTAKTAEEFSDALDLARIEAMNLGRRDERSRIVVSESWTDRAATAASVIDQL